jgi:hypothetical protein
VYTILLFFRPVYDKGQHTLQVPMSMFADNRARLLARLRKVVGVTGSSIVLLQGGDTHNVYCTDAEDVFRQVSKLISTIFSLTKNAYLWDYQVLHTTILKECLLAVSSCKQTNQ